MRKELGGWKPKPLYACVFGSAARGDGDADSDVDLLLVHPPFPGEAKPPRKAKVIDAVAAFITAPMPATPAEASRWPRHVDTLRAHVGGAAIHFRLWIFPSPNGWTGGATPP
jgi:hypothetical protein